MAVIGEQTSLLCQERGSRVSAVLLDEDNTWHHCIDKTYIHVHCGCVYVVVLGGGEAVGEDVSEAMIVMLAFTIVLAMGTCCVSSV